MVPETDTSNDESQTTELNELSSYASRFDDEGLDVGMMVARTLHIQNKLQRHELDTSWVTYGDRAAKFYQRGFDERLSEVNERHAEYSPETSRYWSNDGDGNARIVFPNKAMAVLWVTDISGQISDGVWENDWGLDWQTYYYAKIVVDETADGVTFYHNARTYPNGMDNDRWLKPLDYTERLTEFSAHIGRLVFNVRASGADEAYTEDDLRGDLSLLDEMKMVEHDE